MRSSPNHGDKEMNRKQFEELNVAQRKLELRSRGYDHEPSDILDEFVKRGYEFSLQFINGKWGIVFFTGGLKHYAPFDTKEDALHYAALDVAEPKE
jgi:hypothetical protein